MIYLGRDIAGVRFYADTYDLTKLAAIKAKLDAALRPRPVQPPEWMREFFGGLKSGARNP